MGRSIMSAGDGGRCCTGAAAPKVKLVEPDYHLIPGSVPLDKGPDGNSIFLDAPKGLILVDTGRHPEHAAKLLAYAKERGRPIAAIVNTHWHLDHTTGNLDIRAGLSRGPGLRDDGDRRARWTGFLARPQGAGRRSGWPIRTRRRTRRRRSFAASSTGSRHPDTLRPTIAVTKSGPMKIAGRKLEVHVAPFAATEADLWLYDPDEGLAIVGDLVVDIVPFMDTACPDGWRKALDEVAATPFVAADPRPWRSR